MIGYGSLLSASPVSSLDFFRAFFAPPALPDSNTEAPPVLYPLACRTSNPIHPRVPFCSLRNLRSSQSCTRRTSLLVDARSNLIALYATSPDTRHEIGHTVKREKTYSPSSYLQTFGHRPHFIGLVVDPTCK